MAHIGVLKAFDEAGIKPDLIVGTSMGSIVGVMYAQTGSALEVEKRLKEYISSEEYKDMDLPHYRRSTSGGSFFGNIAKRIEERIVINLSVSQKAVFKQDVFRNALEAMITPGIIEELPIEFAAVTCDLLTGRKIVQRSGDIMTAVLASSSIPGFLPPVKYAGWALVDGEVSDLVPATTAKELRATYVVAVDVSQSLIPSPPLENALDIIFRAGQIKSNELRKLRMTSADFIVSPKVDEYHWTNFDKAEELVEVGYIAGKEKADDLKKMLKRERWKFWK